MSTNFGAFRPSKPYEFFKGPSKKETLGAFLGGKCAEGLVEFGAVYVNQSRVIDPNFTVSENDVIRVHSSPKRYELDKEKVRAQIIFENDNFIVVNKPSGLPMHPTLDNLYENLLYAFEVPVFVTHRLDVPTSGLVLVSKTKEYQRLFNGIISTRRIQKIYEAIVDRALKPGERVHYMKNTVTAPKVFAAEPLEDDSTWLECRLAIRSCVENLDETFKITVELLTGRTHQIRGQLALEGSPILGDEMYGGRAHDTFGLRSSVLSFICPLEGKEMSFKLTN